MELLRKQGGGGGALPSDSKCVCLGGGGLKTLFLSNSLILLIGNDIKVFFQHFCHKPDLVYNPFESLNN